MIILFGFFVSMLSSQNSSSQPIPRGENCFCFACLFLLSYITSASVLVICLFSFGVQFCSVSKLVNCCKCLLSQITKLALKWGVSSDWNCSIQLQMKSKQGISTMCVICQGSISFFWDLSDIEIFLKKSGFFEKTCHFP